MNNYWNGNAPGKDHNGIFGVSDMGMVTLFTSTNGGPQLALATEYTPISLLLSGAVESGRKYGSSLAVGDFYQDGYDDLAVGRPGSSTYAGEVVAM